jgi:hypothetical protein
MIRASVNFYSNLRLCEDAESADVVELLVSCEFVRGLLVSCEFLVVVVVVVVVVVLSGGCSQSIFSFRQYLVLKQSNHCGSTPS